MIQDRAPQFTPEIGIMLGSGWGSLAKDIQHPISIPYEEIPNFPPTTVVGHVGNLLLGQLNNRSIIAMQGRFHFYEGHKMSRLVFPIQLMHRLGVHSLIITSASGSINFQLQPRDLVVLTDHLNFTFRNPLTSSSWHRNPEVYNPELIQLALESGKAQGLSIHTGVYAYVAGPSFETPAEIKMLRVCGGDIVGMSTVPEALTAAALGMRVLGLSYVGNLGAGMAPHPLDHEEMLEQMGQMPANIATWLSHLIGML